MGDVTDLFDESPTEPSVDVDLPPKKKFKARPQIQPAYKIVGRHRLSEFEYQLLYLVLNQMDSMLDAFKRDMALGMELKKIKAQVIKILGVKFNVDMETAKKENLSFNLKDNRELELLKKRDE